ncbi:hypothetical protein BGX28_009370 [Mortierella sp. GBA30]|nr:hypothetical protein BGX28_009370 [Mortierella sp. GBA30]
MSALINWLTIPENDHRFRNAGKLNEPKIVDIQRELAQYVNKISGTTWNEKNIRNNMRYSREKYCQALLLFNKEDKKTSFGGEQQNQQHKEEYNRARRQKILEICPDFDRFYAIYCDKAPIPIARRAEAADSFSSSLAGKRMVEEDSDPETETDISDDDDDFCDPEPGTESRVRTGLRAKHAVKKTIGNNQLRLAKRPRADHYKSNTDSGIDTTTTTVSMPNKLNILIDSIKAVAQSPPFQKDDAAERADSWKNLRRREEALDERERNWADRMLEHELRHDEMLNRRRIESTDQIGKGGVTKGKGAMATGISITARGYRRREDGAEYEEQTLNKNPASLSDSHLASRLQALQESKSKVETQLAELETHREKLKATGGRNTDIPGKLW